MKDYFLYFKNKKIVDKVFDSNGLCDFCLFYRLKHPDIFKCIIMDKKSVPVEMELRSELWSIGVTLYEVAAGKHPFIVPGGRKNKIQMFAFSLLLLINVIYINLLFSMTRWCFVIVIVSAKLFSKV